MNTYSKLAVPQNKYPHTWHYKRTLDATTDSNQCNSIINRANSLFTIILPVDKKRITFSMALSSGRRWAWFLLLLPSFIGFQTLFFSAYIPRNPFMIPLSSYIIRISLVLSFFCWGLCVRLQRTLFTRPPFPPPTRNRKREETENT